MSDAVFTVPAKDAVEAWHPSDATILVVGVGGAVGSRPAAAALACAGADPDRASLLVDLTEERAPRPTLVASASARALEERLAAHLPEARVASRGQCCHLALPADQTGIERLPAALPLVRDAVGVVHLPSPLLQAVLREEAIRVTGALLRADLDRDRALTALAVRDLRDRGLHVAVLKRPLPWIPARRALFGALPPGTAGGLPTRQVERLLAEDGGGAASVRPLSRRSPISSRRAASAMELAEIEPLPEGSPRARFRRP
ncbi:MAG TPA: hypothetical protein VNY83_01265 [Solirubrobacterales bacterium]|nr:hypothetical protein [Solirubrobacterales bacterium]